MNYFILYMYLFMQDIPLDKAWDAVNDVIDQLWDIFVDTFIIGVLFEVISTFLEAIFTLEGSLMFLFFIGIFVYIFSNKFVFGVKRS